MWTAPHLIRADPTRNDGSARFRCACDVWALAVVAYFTLFGAWPFTKQQISQWGSTAAEAWEDYKAVQFPGALPRDPACMQSAHVLRSPASRPDACGVLFLFPGMLGMRRAALCVALEDLSPAVP